MKTITLQLYTFDELSEEVQKEIIERERWNIMDQCMEAYGSDYVTSLRTFEKLTNTQSCSWSVNYSGYNFNFKYNNNPIFECPIDCSNDIYADKYLKNKESLKQRKAEGRYKPTKAEWAATIREHRRYKEQLKKKGDIK